MFQSTKEFAESQGVDVRTVKRWLEKDKIVGAEQDERGRWRIPADAAIRIGTGTGTRGVDALVSPIAAPPAVPTSVSGPLGTLGTLEQAAAVLGTSVGGIRRMADAGLLIVGPFGRNGALRVFVPPVNR